MGLYNLVAKKEGLYTRGWGLYMKDYTLYIKHHLKSHTQNKDLAKIKSIVFMLKFAYFLLKGPSTFKST